MSCFQMQKFRRLIGLQLSCINLSRIIKSLLNLIQLNRVIDCYLKSENPHFKASIFDWIYEVVELDSSFDQ